MHSTEGLNDSDKNMKHFIKENWFKIGILILLVVAAGSASYYYLGFKPQQDEAVLQQQAATQNQAEAQATAQEQQLQNCIDVAQQNFSDTYASVCQSFQTSQNQLGNSNWVCPLTLYGDADPAYPAMVSKEQSDEALCATLYK
jgi:predicted negative regulator of RcsB-dependent stress response